MSDEANALIMPLVLACSMPYGPLDDGYVRELGNRLTELPLPRGREGFDRILRTGVLPRSHERDDEIRMHLGPARARLARLPRRVLVFCGLFSALAALSLVGTGRPYLLVVPVLAYLPLPSLTRREMKRREERYQAIETALDRRRTAQPVPPPDDLARPTAGEHPARSATARGFDTT